MSSTEKYIGLSERHCIPDHISNRSSLFNTVISRVNGRQGDLRGEFYYVAEILEICAGHCFDFNDKGCLLDTAANIRREDPRHPGDA